MRKIILMLLLCIGFVVAAIPDDLNTDVYFYAPYDDDATDDVNSITSTVTNAVLGSGNGIIGNAYSFDGSTTYIDTDTNIDFTDDMTYNFWIKADSTQNAADVAIFERSSNKELVVYIKSTHPSQLSVNTGNSASWDTNCNSNTNIMDDTYHMITITVDVNGNNIKIYDDGVELIECTNSVNMPITDDTLTIGSRYSHGAVNTIDAEIDEFAVFNSLLTVSEIAYLYDSGSPDSDQQYSFGGAAPPAPSTPANTSLDVPTYVNVTNTYSIIQDAWTTDVIGYTTRNYDDSLYTQNGGSYDAYYTFNTINNSNLHYLDLYSYEYAAFYNGYYLINITLVNTFNKSTLTYDTRPAEIITFNQTNTTLDESSNPNRFYFNLTEINNYAINNDISTINMKVSTDGYINYQGRRYNDSLYPSYIKATETILFSSMNLSFYDETSNTILNTTSVDVNIIHTDITDSFTVDNGTILIYPPATGLYTIQYSATGYDPRTYYFYAESGDYENIKLYLIPSNESERIYHSLDDENGNPAEDIYIKLQKYFINTNTYETVSIEKTNYDGKVMFYVELYHEYYKLIYTQEDGTVLGTKSPSAFYDDSITGTDDKVNLEDDAFTSWRIYDNLAYDLDYINNSGDIFARFEYSDVNNVVRVACLKVQRITAQELETVCETCSRSNSATLLCYINQSNIGQYKAVALVDTNTTGSWYSEAIEWFKVNSDTFNFGQNGIFLGFVLVGTLAFIGISSIVGSIVMVILGMIGLSVIGLVIGFNLGFIMLYAVTGIIVLFLARRSTE